ncbi:hypothetical protein F383_07644 [Gossypium arboreum]|uniref:Uncharacterized protein n=1 Tax=Gossypium arboreum TaxID=29729 RepID=A0A0B0PCL1_GOSAR|nr:hypothetical protein F383_07644 [Gossypium arboreum]
MDKKMTCLRKKFSTRCYRYVRNLFEHYVEKDQ